jgi:hypothetical protein
MSLNLFKLGKLGSVSEYDTAPSEYDFIKVLLTTVCTNEIAAIFKSYYKGQ